MSSDTDWKVARDPYLAEVADRWGTDAAFAAGFFLDDDPEPAPLDDVGWLCTPLDHVRRALADDLGHSGTPVVLLATGAFHPLHDGHRLLLERALERAEAAGWWVVGGYVSPGHDQYLQLKWGPDVAPASARIAGLVAALAGTGWLAVDPWEALGRRVSVNYTDVVARLQAYLRHHLRPDVEVAFVGGGDNARFTLSFALRGRAVIVGRPGSDEERDRWRDDPRIVAADDRILWAEGDHPAASSALTAASAPSSPHRVTVRLEDERAVATLGLDCDRWRAFQDGLVAELGRRTSVRTVALAEQVPAPVDGVLSLDPMLPGAADLAVSRHFDLGGHRMLGHGARPGHPSIAEQVGAVGPGPWILRDDDSATGRTIEFVRGVVDVRSVVLSMQHDGGEIADSRDLLLGTDDGGLVVALPDGTAGRAPYLLPFVDPAARGTVPSGDALAFSIAGWDLNVTAFDGTGRTVADLPAPAATVLRHAGHAATTPLVDVARAYAAALRRLVPIGPDHLR